MLNPRLDRRQVLKLGVGASALAVTGSLAATASASPPTGVWQQLAACLTGTLVLPGDSAYPQAKQLYLAEYDAVNPAGIAYCETVADVQTCLAFVQNNAVPFRVRSGGHNLCGWSTCTGLIIDTSKFNHAKVTGDTVHLGPGLPGVDELNALAPYGKQVVTGACPDVCPGGFISGGGVGFQTRKFGIGADRLRSALVVLADGRVVRTSATEEPDLFWALRGGGGGNFGVVLDFEVEPIDQPTGVYFSTVWSWDKAQALLEYWQQWSIQSTHDFGSTMLVLLPDAAPANTPVVVLSGGYWGAQDEIEQGLAAMAAATGTTPTSSHVQTMPYQDVMMNNYGCGDLSVDQCHRVGVNPVAQLPRTGWLSQRNRIFNQPLQGSALTATLEAFDADRYAGEERYIAFTATGGVANEVGRTDTAYWHRDAQFITIFSGHTLNPAPPAAEQQLLDTWSDRGFATLDPVSTGESYLNFPDMRLTDWQTSYYGGNYPRLLEIKNTYDPHNIFSFARSIGSTQQ
ncbi:FAD/FMN-containing dehydrogenase [Catenulispora sp. GAS73]|uniref:FAD-binding oxidoreductase n=1 Tax=Catenulispora sp. GAS73 TaxID=3156269 RepID=UPI003516077E